MVAMVQVVVACVAWVLTTLSILATTSENERHKHIPLGFLRDFWYVYIVNGQICFFFFFFFLRVYVSIMQLVNKQMVVAICNYTFFNSSVSLLLRPHLLTLHKP
ncbi:hypothetical protein HanXRQr2_Chr08g0320361 [Helianthus annuus]|uniref:Uncharacterized protein n=1 Tax=Helianthus annuus TaxID=4232 RepID=A0A9K3IC55_HELAN|nr:hypothetical protein HanXRQr2_Chr08g0320361 [Helianthus annuus]